MAGEAVRISVALISILIAVIVAYSSWWLIQSERAYPRDSFPATRSDRLRGLLWGLAIGVAWVVCDLLLNRFWQTTDADPRKWMFRFAMLAMFVLAGHLTLTEFFRILRCRRNRPPSEH